MSIGDIGTGGLTGAGGFALAILTYLAKQYFDNRKENREDKKADREDDNAVVQTTDQVLAVVRKQIAGMQEDRDEDRATIRALKGQLGQAEDRIDHLEAENTYLKRQMGIGDAPQQAWSGQPVGYTGNPVPRTPSVQRPGGRRRRAED